MTRSDGPQCLSSTGSGPRRRRGSRLVLVDTWEVTRPFWWGMVLLMDRDGTDVPPVTDSIVSTSDSGLAIKVRHASDVDLQGVQADEVVPPALVHIYIRTDDRPPPDVPFAGQIVVPSGVLSVGDADEEAALEIGSGPWAVHVDCVPADCAETVSVWLRKV